jgi:hypothetical protein
VRKTYKRKWKDQKCHCYNLKKANPQRSGKERRLFERPGRVDEDDSVLLC